MKIKSMLVGALCALSVTFTLPAQSLAAESRPVNCVQLSRIDQTHVVDDRTILFYMKGGDVYVNRLKHAAAGLDERRPFMYQTSIGRLCDKDTVTVLENWGFGLTPGAASPLGKFELIDEEQAEALRAGQVADVDIEAVE
ncbi:MAG: hypothetical protein R3305_07470 [Gammaproteobacteria bacterium]|nr:hypothetical protein [Gammaproteobacteria bacterium]